MPDPSVVRFTYRAFISYSHRDKAWADWLHKALETYHVPSRLVGRSTAHGTIPRRLNPVFRDRDELSSSPQLGTKINEALAQSENLIVICSPASADSRWVNEEVLAYKRMGRAGRIFCLIVDGEPDATDLPGRAREECFCPALRFATDADGRPTTERVEPIAADVRPGKDGKANAKLKLIAGMLDISFDALKQREQHRRTRRMAAITALSLLVMAVTSVLAVYALVSRHVAVIAQHKAEVAEQAAERRQKQAEGLVDFMLGDLNDKLNQVHRLDIMQDVDERAMAYFATLPAADASDAALELRVKALDKIGMVMSEAHGHLDDAMKAYQSAAALAGELALRAPGNANREITLGESLNMVGVAWWNKGQPDNALKSWRSASTLFQRAHSAKPKDDRATENLASIRNNIGHVLESRNDLDGARIEYEASLKLYQQLAAHERHDPDQQSNVAWGWDNLGKLAVERGELDRALTDYLAEHRIKAKLASASPGNHVVQEDLMASNAILGRTLALCGETDAALHYTEQAVNQGKTLLAFEPSDTDWLDSFALYSQQLGGLLRQAGRLDEAAAADDRSVRTLTMLLNKDPASSSFRQHLAQAQLEFARLLLAKGRVASAANAIRSAQSEISKLRGHAPDDRDALLLDAQAYLLLGRSVSRSEDSTARRDWIHARDLLLPAVSAGNDPNFLATYVEALFRLNRIDTARSMIARLGAMGYRAPDFVHLLADSHVDYPPNVTFRKRVAILIRGDATDAAPSTGDVANTQREDH